MRRRSLLRLRSGRPMTAIVYFALGVAVWTLLEYAVHRFVLHGRFPAGKGPVPLVHAPVPRPPALGAPRAPLGREPHQRHDQGHAAVRGRVRGRRWLFPLATGRCWSRASSRATWSRSGSITRSHFYRFDNPYFQYIRRHHLYHHSPKGMEVAFGLSNGFWDIVWDTAHLRGRAHRALPRQAPPAGERAGAHPDDGGHDVLAAAAQVRSRAPAQTGARAGVVRSVLHRAFVNLDRS
jgi:hypothetical protein